GGLCIYYPENIRSLRAFPVLSQNFMALRYSGNHVLLLGIGTRTRIGRLGTASSLSWNQFGDPIKGRRGHVEKLGYMPISTSYHSFFCRATYPRCATRCVYR